MSGVDEYGLSFGFAMLMLAVYAIFASMIAEYKFKYMHESGVAIILGIIMSVIIYYTYNEHITFEIQHFLYIFLPPIVFAEGIRNFIAKIQRF